MDSASTASDSQNDRVGYASTSVARDRVAAVSKLLKTLDYLPSEEPSEGLAARTIAAALAADAKEEIHPDAHITERLMTDPRHPA